jgi:signal transduction histidine kinase/ligand-binding sensor domain-containing protein
MKCSSNISNTKPTHLQMPFKQMAITLLFLAIFHHSFLSIAQPPHPIKTKRCPVSTINYKQGVINNSIVSVITDVQGFTWISTAAGLQRYNGYFLQTVNPVVNGSLLSLNYPVYLLAGENHTILIGYKKGILEYDCKSNTFNSLVTLDNGASNNYSLVPIKQTNEGIWCFEDEKGIVIYNHKSSLIEQFPASKNAIIVNLQRAEDYNITRKIIASNSKYIFLRISLNTLLQINLQQHQTKTITYPGSGILGIECDERKIYIASAEGLANMNIETGRISMLSSYKSLNEYPVTRSSIELSTDNHLLVTVEKHLYEFDTSGTCKKEFISLNNEPLLKSGYIQTVYEDKFRRIWLLTHEDIKRIQNAETPFEKFIYPNIKDNFIRAVYYDKDKNILLAGAFAGVVMPFDSSGNPIWEKPVGMPGLKWILSIEKLTSDQYLILTLNQGMYLLNFPKKTITRINTGNLPTFNKDLFLNAYSNNLQRINDSTLLISTKANIYRCHIRNNHIIDAGQVLNTVQLNGKAISCFRYANDKSVWISASSGTIIKLSPTGSTTNIPVPNNYIIHCLAEDGQHNIWAGTERGIYIFNSSGTLIKQINRESGMLSDCVYILLPADSNTNSFYASTNFGICYVSAKGIVNNYTRELGLQENEFNTQSGTLAPNGKLFFGGINGITAFYPSHLTGTKDSTIINISRLIVDDSLYNSFGGEFKGDTITLNYKQNHIQFDIAATGLLEPDEYVYKYRLNGFENSWQTSSRATGIRYTLQPGSYRLEIKCSPQLFLNSSFQKIISIIITPPFWSTWWFITLSVLGLGLLIFGVSNYIIRQRYLLKSKKLELKQQLATERERISRELHDNIGSQLSYISNNIDWLTETPGAFSKEDALNRLSMVNDSAKNLIADLRETIWAMKRESITLDELSDKIKQFLQSQCILKPSMDLAITEKLERPYQLSPTEALNIFRTCQEAISNSIQHAEADKLEFSIHSSNTVEYAISITDNGKGFDLNKQFNSHYGIENMKHRTQESGANLEITTFPGKGTKIVISKNVATNSPDIKLIIQKGYFL